MTNEFVREVIDTPDVLYFPFCDWLFPNGLKINNVMFTIPWFNDTSIDVYWYGFLIAFGMLLAVIYASRRMRKFGLDSDRSLDVVLAGLVGGIVGARLYYVVFKLKELYLTDEGNLDLVKIFNVRDGGLAIYGGVIGALIFGAVVAKIRKVRMAPMLDLVALGFLIGQAMGRWGNFFNQECFGVKTSLPWGMTSSSILQKLYFFYYPENVSVVTNRAKDMVAHPCFLYESLWCIVGFLILHFYSKKFRKFDGEIFLLYIGWYGAGRFWIEGLRTDSLYIPGPLHLKVSQVVAGTCVLFSLILLVYNYLNVKKNGYTFYYETDESKELLAMKDEKAKKARRADANAELSEHILAEDSAEDSEDEAGAFSGASDDEAAKETLEEAAEESEGSEEISTKTGEDANDATD